LAGEASGFQSGLGAGNFCVTGLSPAASVETSATNKNKTRMKRLDMLRALILAVGLSSALAIAANAADNEKKPDAPKRPPLTEEQKALRKEITEKYDKDKDGKLSAEERKAISEEDKARMQKAGLGPRRKPEAPK
jgi:hypothetical protein